MSSMPSMNSSAITSASYFAAARVGVRELVVRRDVTLVMPMVEPSRAGFTISGRPSSATTRIQSVCASTTR